MIRWNDYDHPATAFDAFRKIFDELERPTVFNAAPSGGLPVTVFDAGSTLVLSFEVPGLSEKDFTLSLAQNVLTIQGERRLRAPEGYAPQRQERAGARFSRSYALPCRVDADRTEAALKDGVLTVTLAKAVEAQPRTISVSVGLGREDRQKTGEKERTTMTTSAREETKSERRAVTPAVDVYESRSDFLLVADLPGVKQEDLKIKLEHGELSLEGVRKPRAAGALLAGHDREVIFKRAFTLPGGIDADKIEAKLAQGVLQLRIPKADSLRPRQISVTVG